jgi:hypothetical protein
VVATEDSTEFERDIVSEPLPSRIERAKKLGYEFIELDDFTLLAPANLLGRRDAESQIKLLTLLSTLTNSDSGLIDLAALPADEQASIRGMFAVAGGPIPTDKVMSEPNLRVSLERRSDVWFERNGTKLALPLKPLPSDAREIGSMLTSVAAPNDPRASVGDSDKPKPPANQLSFIYPPSLSLAMDRLSVSASASEYFRKSCDEIRKRYYESADLLMEKIARRKGRMTDGVDGDQFRFGSLSADTQSYCAQVLYAYNRGQFDSQDDAEFYLKGAVPSEVHSEIVLTAFFKDGPTALYTVMAPFRCPLGLP